ncbi:MAG: hypothetical protein AMXMBFR64_60160 [Myxococcales bacterium]
MSAARKKIVSILAILGILGAAGAFGVWWFAFRKNPETVAEIEKINETQQSVDEALGWDDPPESAPAK